MSDADFFNELWTYFIAIITVVGMLACALLLWQQGRQKVAAPGDADNTTGHVWDGDLRELNNPLPRWWMWMFYLTVVFSLGYLVVYPGLTTYRGSFGWTSAGAYELERAALEKQIAPLYAGFTAKSAEQLGQDPEAMAVGGRLFLNNCAQCHGSDARGSKGFPNLTDSDWLYGGSAEAIRTSITDGRNGFMPPMGDAIGGEDAARNVAQYVLSLSGRENDPVRANLGRSKFSACAACHGADGKGNPLLGAPNLTDRIWLHGGREADIVQTIMQGRSGTMPVHKDRLTEAQIHVLTGYLMKISGASEAATPVASTKP
ncbi:cytochrome-c oxidase, cbb3-type subunit III [Pigmentiphaga aceris]|uniref:Cbb3-type cytochrome c oxidase subunit n=1 Tax=Pigmentiphaga aceris TaxID=1940612 RepID=A0A5C0AUH5_9BURK|nr:cytochrome-c oxidase, cbb3-type subunit III [Pigmentiphaga aceris]QEI05366.1 cytochrome-c oxidase, cbb3-type subunit III [Pigmentiphaga aceris]